MKNLKNLFGTDGIRGIANKDMLDNNLKT